MTRSNNPTEGFGTTAEAGERHRPSAAWVAAILSQLPSALSSGTTPTITSDKADYNPGEQVTLTGSNWADGETVHIVVNDTVGQTWKHTADVVAATDGSINDVFNLPNVFVSDYDVTATRAHLGDTTTAFTDANPSADLDQCANDPAPFPKYRWL